MTTDGVDAGRRRFLTAATSVVGAVGAACVAAPFLASWRPSAKAQAAGAPVEVDIARIGMGQMITVEWRGKPVWILRRSPEMLNTLASLGSQLRDPDSTYSEQPDYARNPHRSIKPEYLVTVGLCTHLGCVPTYRPDVGGVSKDWPGGFFCPCHGSTYDFSARVYKDVPAPLNLPIPPHEYLSDTLILIGQDQHQA